MTNRKTRKWWITPENEIILLNSWHYEYFRPPAISQKYGVIFRDEEPTRLDALRVGFVRMNYELKGGCLTIETMRWDRSLRKVVDGFVLEHADAIDMARIHRINLAGQAEQIGCVSLMDLRTFGKPINRMTLGSWNMLRVTRLENRIQAVAI
jgi:hypothetical protein